MFPKLIRLASGVVLASVSLMSMSAELSMSAAQELARLFAED